MKRNCGSESTFGGYSVGVHSTSKSISEDSIHNLESDVIGKSGHYCIM